MSLKLVTAPTTEPVTLAEAKDHLQVGSTTSFDAYITRLITVGRAWAEYYMRRWVPVQTWDVYSDTFNVGAVTWRDFPTLVGGPVWYMYDWAPGSYPAGMAQRITLPMAGITSVDSVKYTDTASTLQTLTVDTDYTVDVVSEPARIVPAVGKTWPTPLNDLNSVVIRVTAGSASAPEPIKQAILLLVGDLFERRVDTHIGAGSPTPMPWGAKALMSPYRMLRFS